MRWSVANTICQCEAPARQFASALFIVMSFIAWQSCFQTAHVCTICCILCSVPPPSPVFLLCEMQWVVMLVLYSLFYDAVKRKHICSAKLSFLSCIHYFILEGITESTFQFRKYLAHFFFYFKLFADGFGMRETGDGEHIYILTTSS